MGLIQSNAVQGTSSITETGTLASAPVSGNLIIAFPFAFDATARTLSNVTDTQGNTYLPVQGPIVNGSDQAWLYYCASAIGGGSGIQITATWTTAASFPTIGWAEFSGYRLLDASAPATGPSGTVTASCTSTVANDLVVGWLNANGGGALVGGGTALFALGSDTLAQYMIAGAPGVQTSSATGATTAWVAIVAAFKPFGVAGGIGGSLIGAYDFWGGGFS